MNAPRWSRPSGLLWLALLAACGEGSRSATLPAGPDVAGATRPGAALIAPVPGSCATITQLQGLATTAYGGATTDLGTVLTKLNELYHSVFNHDYATAKTQAFGIVDFTLTKYASGTLGGTTADVVAFVNTVFCYAGLAISITDPANSFLIFPGDAAQILVASSGLAGVSLPGNPVSEATLITVAPIPFLPGAPGAGPLSTKLDQYPGFFQFSKSSETDAPFTQPVVVGVCPAASVPAAVRGRLRLGHDASYGFELAASADAGFLDCAAVVARLDAPSGLFARAAGQLAALVLPRVAAAATSRLGSGGVGGTVTELSPFAPVDEMVALSGGVGGTVTELIRLEPSLLAGCPVAEAPAGAPLDPDCRPNVRLRTALGTPLQGAPITFAIQTGGGAAAVQNATGGCTLPFGTEVTTTTSLTGRAIACWTLGAIPGSNSLLATPGVGGDVPAGVSFSPTSVRYTATGTAAELVSFNSCTPGGSGDVFTDPAKPRAFWIPDPGQGKTIRQVQLYVSSAGKANAPATYRLRLSIQRGSFDPSVAPASFTDAEVVLRGNNSETSPVTFVLSTPVVGAGGTSALPVMLRLDALNNPDGARLSFNTGMCSPGKSCRPPPTCNVTEVSSLLPYPAGTSYRKSVAINVLGN